jgi:hypothetical protein
MNQILIILTICLTVLTGCSRDLNDYTQPWYYPGVGAKLVLHQRLTIKPDTAALYIQQGKITGSKHSRFDPYCKIRVRNVANTITYINPDTFTITRSGHHTELVAGLSGIYVPLGGSFRPQARIQIGSADAPSDITETIFMKLSSNRQPNVISLICGGVEDNPANAEPPTFQEMETALGNIMSLKIPY